MLFHSVPISLHRGTAHHWNDLLLRLVGVLMGHSCTPMHWTEISPPSLGQIIVKSSDLPGWIQNVTNFVCNKGIRVWCEAPDWVTELWALARLWSVWKMTFGTAHHMLSNCLMVLDAHERYNDLKVAQKQKAAQAKLPVKSTSYKILNRGRMQGQ